MFTLSENKQPWLVFHVLGNGSRVLLAVPSCSCSHRSIQRCQAHRYYPSKVSGDSSTTGGALWLRLMAQVPSSLQRNKANVLQADPCNLVLQGALPLSGSVRAPPLGTYINQRIIWQGARADFLNCVLGAESLAVKASGMGMNNRCGLPSLLPEFPHSIGFLPAGEGSGRPRLRNKQEP